MIGQNVIISCGFGIPDTEGHISYISPIVDEHTRTATARVVLANEQGIWRPGLFVEGRIIAEEEDIGILVPKSALQKMHDEDVVLVRNKGSFRPQSVRVGRTDALSVEKGPKGIFKNVVFGFPL